MLARKAALWHGLSFDRRKVGRCMSRPFEKLRVND